MKVPAFLAACGMLCFVGMHFFFFPSRIRVTAVRRQRREYNIGFVRVSMSENIKERAACECNKMSSGAAWRMVAHEMSLCSCIGNLRRKSRGPLESPRKSEGG